jgi:two-component system NtrC family sensor kinase
MTVSANLPWWQRLSVRLTAVIALVSLATMAAFAYAVIRTQQRHLVNQVVESAALLSDTVKLSVYYHMLEDKRPDVYRSLATIGGHERFCRARLFNKEGRITFSTDQGEQGTYVDKRAESCYACHAENQPITRLNLPLRSRIYRHEGHRVLGMVTPIYNEPACSTAACHAHPPDRTVLGVVDLGISLEPIDAALAQLERATLLGAGLSVLGLAGIVTWFVRKKVLLPVHRLAEGTRRVAAGNLKQPVPIVSNDELGLLAGSFNEMEQSLSKIRAERLALLDSLEGQVEERTAALKQAQDRLVQSEKLSSLGRLAASVAHEINNPLAGILTYSKLIIRTIEDGDTSPKAREAAVKQLKLVQRETERCTAIVRNLLDFARERPLKLADVGVNAAADEALMLVANQARLQNVELVKELRAERPVHADFGQIRQALINVIINACDAMPKGGRLRVSTRDNAATGEVEVDVADTGTGIPPEHLKKVLDPFFTTKEKGTGLGLSVVYGIVERHGGRVEIDSAVGQGTTVRLRLPAAPRRPAQAVPASGAAADGDVAGGAGPPR